MASAFVEKDIILISGGTDNHMMLIGSRIRTITGKMPQNALVKAGGYLRRIKNMVPFVKITFCYLTGIVWYRQPLSQRLKEDQNEDIVRIYDQVIMEILKMKRL